MKLVYSLDLLARSGTKVKKRSQWGSQYPISSYTIGLPGRYLFMHITVTHQTGTLDTRTKVVERIGAQRFPNTRFSYNAVLHKGGEVHEGQPRGRKGAHTINNKKVSGFPHDLNAYGHALAYVGMEASSFGEAEIESAARYFAALVLSGESTAKEILPHNRFAFKACPGAKVMAQLAEINRRFKRYVANGLPGSGGSTSPSPRSVNVLLGLKRGDRGAEVRVLQILLGYAGFPPSNGVQSVSTATYGAQVSAAVLAMRKAMGSSATSGDVLDTYAYSQLFRALARREAGKDGKDGGPGPRGIRGEPGTDGRNGIDGKDGVDGKDGIDGKDGQTPTEVAILGQVVKVAPAPTQ